MILMLISAVFAVIFIQLFAITYSYQGLNKAIIFTPIELMYSDVSVGLEGANINQKLVKEHLNNYYAKTLPKYCKNYRCEYYFYNKEDESLCINEYCDGVEISIYATLNLDINYYRVMYYELKDGAKNG